MAIVLDGTTGITAPDVDSKVNGLNYPDASSMGFRNRIINGDMRIDQRNAGAATAGAGSSPYTLDRWKVYSAGANNPVQRVAGPAGYQYAMQISGIASNTACVAFQRIEAANIADLASVSATASFLIYNSGASFSATVRFQNPTTTVDDFSALTSIASNSITVPNGWTTITTSVSLTSGVARGLQFEIDLLTAMTAGRTVQITGVQLEAGSVATPFERRPYGTELALCQRYFTSLGGDSAYQGFAAGIALTTTIVAYALYNLPVSMRSAPAVAASGSFRLDDGYAASHSVTGVSVSQMGTSVGSITVAVASGLTSGRFYQLQANNSTASRLQFSSEL